MPTFHDQFVELFDTHFARLFRYLDRLSGEPDLAADLAQEAFVRLYRRGFLPERPEAWLITVAMNLFRNARAATTRRARLLTGSRAEVTLADPAPDPQQQAEASEARLQVGAALRALPEREQRILLLRAEGYAYREIASALDLNEASVGTLLARAKRAFREAYDAHAS
jgi:RNA polymerase sigma-70 factor, ECF subfamily